MQGWGTFWLGWTRRGLALLSLPTTEDGPLAPADAEARVRALLESSFDPVARESVVPPRFARPIQRYFAGEREPLDLPLDLVGTPFQVRVWRALCAIPHGRVRTYAGIAADVGEPRATRAVGQANHVNPIAVVVPCHRVVEAGLRLGGYAGGLAMKRRLLALEGVEVRGDVVVPPGQLSLVEVG